VEDLGVDEGVVETRGIEKTRGQGEGRRGEGRQGDGAMGRDTVELKYPKKIRLKQNDESHIP
jgi:hypothetical protein